jgi:hypothetical protein
MFVRMRSRSDSGLDCYSMQLNRVGRLEGRAHRSPSGKRDFVSNFVVFEL